MRIIILTDAWFPHVSGVVTTIKQVRKELKKKGHTVRVISHLDFKISIPCPTYSEIKLPLDFWTIKKIFKDFRPQAIHIATPEGSVGLSGMLFCRKHRLLYTTDYHTKLPDYIRHRFPIPKRVTYAYLRWLHSKAKRIFISTYTMKKELEEWDFPANKLVVLEKGINHKIFHPGRRSQKPRFSFEPPVLLYAGRVAIEKNLEEFLDLDIPGTKVVVGDGPARNRLIRKFPNAVYTGYQYGEDLASYYANADVFVFPSLTDTYGIVLLEAIACGTPIAAHRVTGPKDIVTEGINGYLGPDLKKNIEKCLLLDRGKIYQSSSLFSWSSVANKYLNEFCYINGKI